MLTLFPKFCLSLHVSASTCVATKAALELLREKISQTTGMQRQDVAGQDVATILRSAYPHEDSSRGVSVPSSLHHNRALNHSISTEKSTTGGLDHSRTQYGAAVNAPEAAFASRASAFSNDIPSARSQDLEASTTMQTATSSQIDSISQAYLLKICRALMSFGAPTHRLEMYMQATASVLELSLQSFHLPGCMILSINERQSGFNQVHIVRCTSSLDLAKLYAVHGIHKAVIHRELCVEDATERLEEIMTKPGKFPTWFQVLNYGLASAFIGPVSYSARPVDLPIIFILGAVVGILELVVSRRAELYGYIFEITSAILVSLLGRALGSIPTASAPIFCFSAIAQASIVLILPGFTLTVSALEIQTGNMVSGSVRIVYGIVYTLFLAFGFTIGITIYGALDSNATSAIHCQNPWPVWWQIAFVLPFTVCFIIVKQGDWRNMPGMLFVTLSGWVVNHFSSSYFASIPAIGQALGALTAGVLANLMSRLGLGFAAAMLHPAIFIQVPGSLAASGSLIGGIASADNLTRVTDTAAQQSARPGIAILDAGYAAVEIAIGITVGLSVSAFVVYPFRKKTGKSGIFSF